MDVLDPQRQSAIDLIKCKLGDKVYPPQTEEDIKLLIDTIEALLKLSEIFGSLVGGLESQNKELCAMVGIDINGKNK